MAVLPFGRSGIISGAMLGLGRALGETMAVAIVLSASGGDHVQPDHAENPSTIAANIALKFPESTGLDVNTLIATRPGAVRHHARGQHVRPLRSSTGAPTSPGAN